MVEDFIHRVVASYMPKIDSFSPPSSKSWAGRVEGDDSFAPARPIAFTPTGSRPALPCCWGRR